MHGPFEAIRSHFNQFTANQKKLASFIDSSPDATAFLTTTELAQKAGVSQSTVVRFAKSLGYAGFPSFQSEIRKLLVGKLNPSDRLQKSPKNTQVVDATFDADVRNLTGARDALRNGVLEQAIELLWRAKHTYVLGLRTSFSMAYLLATTLRQIRPSVTLVRHGTGSVVDEIMSISEKDVLFAVCFPRYSRETIQALRLAKEKGATTVVLTDSALGSPGREADLAIVTPCSISSFFTSYAGVVLVINALIAGITEKSRDKAVHSLHELEHLLESWGHWSDD